MNQNQNSEASHVLALGYWLRFVLLILIGITLISCLSLLEIPLGYEKIAVKDELSAGFPLFIAYCLALAAILPGRTESSGDYILWILAYFLAIPTLVLSTFNPFYDGREAKVALSITTISLVIIVLFIRIDNLLVSNSQIKLRILDKSRLNITVFFAVLAIVLLLIDVGVSTLSISYSDLYSRRLAFRDFRSNLVGSAYLYSILSTTIVSLMFVVGLKEKRKYLIFLSLTISIMGFAINGRRDALVTIAFAILVYLSRLRSRFSFLMSWPITLMCVISLPTIYGLLSGNIWSAISITRRLAIVPSQLTIHYVSVRELTGDIWFSSSIGRFFGIEASNNIAYIAGQSFSGRSTMNANVNFIGDGYISGGYLGVVICSLIVCLLLILVNSLARKVGQEKITIFFVPLFLYILNGSVFTTMISGGLIPNIALVMLLYNNKKISNST